MAGHRPFNELTKNFTPARKARLAAKRLTPGQLAELKSLAALPDDAIDRSDAPELPDWSGAKRGLLPRAD